MKCHFRLDNKHKGLVRTNQIFCLWWPDVQSSKFLYFVMMFLKGNNTHFLVHFGNKFAFMSFFKSSTCIGPSGNVRAKNPLVQIHSKLNEKIRVITNTNLTETHF